MAALSELGLEGSGEADDDRLCIFLGQASPSEPSSDLCLIAWVRGWGNGGLGWRYAQRDPVLLPPFPEMHLSTNRGQGDLRKRYPFLGLRLPDGVLG